MSTNKYFGWKQLLLLLFLTASCAVLWAQNYHVQKYTIADGLSQGMIYDILQDQDGFMWFATKDGLNRYDGYRFEVFTHDPFNPFSISGNDIHRLFEDHLGNIWVSVYGKGFDVLEKNSGKFLHLPLKTGRDRMVSAPFMTKTPDGILWLGTVEGLQRLQWKNPGHPDTSNPDLLASGSVEISKPERFQERPVSYLHAQSDGRILLYSAEEGVFRFDPATGNAELMLPNEIPNSFIHIFAGSSDRCWVIRAGKIYLIEKNGGPREIFLGHAPQDFVFSRIFSDGRGRLIWVFSSIDKGCYFFAAPESEIALKGRAENAALIYQTGLYTPWSQVDRAGNLWVGTSGYGLEKTNLFRLPFQHLFQGTSIQQLVSGDKIYFRNSYSKLEWLDENSRSMREIATALPKGALVFYQFDASNAQTYFLCLKDEVPFFVHKNGDALEWYRIKPPSLVTELVEDQRGRIWTSMGSSLMCFLPAEKRVVYLDFSEKLGNEAEVYALHIEGEQTIWVGTTNGILKLAVGNLEFDKKNEYQISDLPAARFEIFRTDPTNTQSIRHNFVTSFCPDPIEPERFLWVSTKGGGLNELDKSTGTFRHFTSQNSSLPNDVIYGILPDGQGNLWMSTNRGLSRLTINGSKGGLERAYRFRNFREFDGLQSDEFNTGSFAKGRDGRLYFGGVNGLTVFDPTQIVDRKSDAKILITGLKINNLPVNYFEKNSPLDRPIHRTETLRLNYLQSIVTLDFSLMDFVNPEENRYRYQLHGVDPDWVAAGTNHTANYTNLNPGSYLFEVQGSIGGEEWSASAQLRIIVLPPWWATWWAYSLYALALFTAAYAFYKFRLRQQMEHKEALRLRELDEFKSRFFTNITHEFRTPLTVILGMAEQVEPKVGPEIKHKISLIRQNGQNLLRLINQILDLSKLESNSLKMNYVQGDVLPYLRYIAESLHSLANVQNVMLRVESSEAAIVMDYDPERLLQIVFNLLSNAIKFTPGGGRVDLRISTDGLRLGGQSSSIANRQSSITIQVVDTGVGIPPADLPNIFDRFYQAENQEHTKAGGTGIGLSLTKELVKAMGGEISVESEMGKGTTFTVKLPISNRADFQSRNEDFRQSEPVPAIENPKSKIEIPKSSFVNVLLIEDNPDVIEYLATCLNSASFGEGQGEAYRLDFAYNGRAGIEKALETVPDLIISDVMMPEKDGFEVCDFLKNDERTSHIPIILLTAKAEVESRIAGLKRGADAYLTKPFHQEELLVTLANLLELRRKLQLKYLETAIQPSRLARTGAEAGSLVTSHESPEDVFLKKLRLIVEENLSNTELDGELICRKIGMSRSNLHAKLSALTGMPISHYVRAMRLHRAKELLQTTPMNVSEVAYEVGFDNPKYFTRLFSEEFGMPPSSLRK